MFQNNLMMAAGSLGGNVVTFELTATPDAQGSATTHTYSSVSLGTAKTGRQIVVCVSNGGTTELTSVTVGGSSCTRVVQGTFTKGSIWIISLDTGTSADIVTTGTAQFGGIVVYAIYGAKATRHDTFATGNESPVSDVITIPANGLAIGLNNSATDDAGWETTWTGLTKQSDLEVSTNVALSTATLTPATVQTDLGVTATIDGPTINWQDGCCASWEPSTGFMEATGGTETTDGDYKVHTFNSSGTFTVLAVGKLATVDYLVIAGGGGGGKGNTTQSYGCGGGGAGGYLTATDLTVTAQAYSITIGAGGAGASSNSSTGSKGSDSVFSSITSEGGGHGAGGGHPGTSGGDGGSGGGGAKGSSGAGGSGNAGPPRQGYDGGDGTGAGHNSQAGGGGASEVGEGPSGDDDGGDGGDGLASSITGASVTRGGGGGGTGTPNKGDGGAGGGGYGATGNSTPGADGTANTGGGGGAGGGGSIPGRAGGSGVVIIRYQFQ